MNGMRTRGSAWWWAMGCLCALAVTATAVRAAAPWKVLDRERGIEVALREEPGRDLPTMRGRGKLEGDVLSALAVILDAKRGPEWAEGSDESHIVKHLSEGKALVYSHTELTWPVSDRDMVMMRRVKVLEPGKEYKVLMDARPNAMKRKDGVIRIVDGSLFFHIKQVDPEHFWMEYQVNIDPGGSLPTWLVRRASKSIPFETFVALEKQVAKTRGQYADVKARWAEANAN